MKKFKTNIILSTMISAFAILSTTAHADDEALKKAYQSANVKDALINVCKTETAKGKQLSTAEVAKYCTCAVEADGKLTNAQKWEIQSAVNQKKNPSTLAFVQKQNADLKACFGAPLTTKLQQLSEAAMSQAKK